MPKTRSDGTRPGSVRSFIEKDRTSRKAGRRRAKKRADRVELDADGRIVLNWQGDVGHIGRIGGGTFHCKSCDAGLHLVPTPPQVATDPDMPTHVLYCVPCQAMMPPAESGKQIEDMIDVMLEYVQLVAPQEPEPLPKNDSVDTGLVAIDGAPIHRKLEGD